MLPLAIVVAGIVPKQQHTALATMLMIGLGSWAAEARVLRAQALALRNTDFVASATAVGESRARILFFEFVPNMASRVAAGAFFVAIQAMVALATLDFLASLSRGRFALGDTNGATWGSLLALAQTQEALLTGSWWAFAFPALALLTLAAGLVLTMYGIEEIADPRLRRAGRARRFGVRVPSMHLPRLPQIEASVAAARAALGGRRSAARRAPSAPSRRRSTSSRSGSRSPSPTRCRASPRAAGCRRRRRRGRSGAAMRTSSAKSATGHLGLGVAGVGGILSHSLPFSLALVGTATVLGFADRRDPRPARRLAPRQCRRRRGYHRDRGPLVDARLRARRARGRVSRVRWHLFPIQWAYGIDLRPAWTWQFAASAFRHGELPLIVLVSRASVCGR